MSRPDLCIHDVHVFAHFEETHMRLALLALTAAALAVTAGSADARPPVVFRVTGNGLTPSTTVLRPTTTTGTTLVPNSTLALNNSSAFRSQFVVPYTPGLANAALGARTGLLNSAVTGGGIYPGGSPTGAGILLGSALTTRSIPYGGMPLSYSGFGPLLGLSGIPMSLPSAYGTVASGNALTLSGNPNIIPALPTGIGLSIAGSALPFAFGYSGAFLPPPFSGVGVGTYSMPWGP
jgi:hypothetical protein